jgi:DNA-binding MarR family transcriptional regulator
MMKWKGWQTLRQHLDGMLTPDAGRMATKDSRQSLPDEEKRSVKSLIMAIEAFRDMRHDMPLQYVHTFLLVAEEEGLGVTEYAERAGVSQSVMSRHLLDIGDRDRYREPGFGLVHKRQDPMELRKQRVFLTDKGRAIARRILRAWGR